MPNRIPTKYRRQVEERANRNCELCGSPYIDGIHHIIPRRKRIHRPETLILSCKSHHDLIEDDSTGMQKQLQVELQQFYYNMGYIESNIRKLMGGKIYLYEDKISNIIQEHFARLNVNVYQNDIKQALNTSV